MAFEIFMIILLITTNGIFALSEIALVKASKVRLQYSANKGNRKAREALELANAPNQFLTTLKVGITLVGVLTGAYGARTVAERLSAYLALIPAIQPYSQSIALAVVVIAITYVSLIIGDFVPRRLALRDPETIAAFVATPMHALSRIFAPAVRVVSLSTDALLRLFGRVPKQEYPVTEEEIKTLIQKGTEAGVLEESEQEMVEAVLRLGDKSARALMTPRSQIIWFEVSDGAGNIRQKIKKSGHSRFPVATQTLDNVLGVVQAKDLLVNALAGGSIDLKACIQEPLFVPRTMSALRVLESFKQSAKHIALVIDEYGGIEGLLTHHDFLEAIAGDIPLAETPAEPKAVQRHDGSWLLDGMLSVDEFKEIFKLESLPGEKKDAYQTLGGFIFTHMGRVPSVSEHFEWKGLRFEVVDMDGKRIDKVLVAYTTRNALTGAEFATGTKKHP